MEKNTFLSGLAASQGAYGLTTIPHGWMLTAPSSTYKLNYTIK